MRRQSETPELYPIPNGEPPPPSRSRVLSDPEFPSRRAKDDSCWQLVERVAGSTAFEKSHRLRELLIYLSRHVLQSPGRSLPEQEIGIAVFHRAEGYDTTLDNIVRVQVSQLRKKLASYFDSAEGLDEIRVIEIPRGAYRPVFVERSTPSITFAPAVPAGRQRLLHVVILGLALSTLGFAALYGWSTWQREDIMKRFLPTSRGASVERLWRSLFGNGYPVSVVMADAGLTIMDDMLGESLDLRQFLSPKQIESKISSIKDPHWHRQMSFIAQNSYVSLADSRVASRLERLSSMYGGASDIGFARFITAQTLMKQNVILLGNARANPWVSMFDDRLNFRYQFEESSRQVRFVNLAPRKGEAASYLGVWGREGFCHIATRPNLTGSGNVMILSGTSMPNVEACGEIVSSERWLSEISGTCASTFPYFEALFKASVLNNTSPQFNLVATRCTAR